MVMNKQLIVC